MSLVVPFAEIFEHKRGVLTNHHSWERTELGMVCEVLNGFPFKSPLFNKSKGFPVIRIRDLSKGKTETFFNGKFPSEYVINNGDLLIGMDGIFRCVEWRGGKAGLNQRVCKIIPNEKYLDRKFLLAGLNGYLKAIEDATSSVTVGHLSSRDILRIPFPVPPLAEQRRIVARLEALLGKVDACQRRLDKIPVLLKRFRQSLLSAACSGRLTSDWREANPEKVDAGILSSKIQTAHEDVGGHRLGNAAPPTEDVHDLTLELFPAGWRLLCLRDLVSPERPITYGILKPGPEFENGVPYVRVADFPNNKLNLGTVRKTSPSIDQKFKRSRLIARDILLSIRGTVGRLVVIPPELEGANITQDSARLSIQPSVNWDYVLWYLRSDLAQSRMKGAVKGVAVRGINIGDVRALQVALPSCAEQNEIVRRVEALFAFADHIEERYAKGKAYADKLTQSILAKTFRGDLVPQDENDEPASVLLDRIRAQRASVVATLPIRKPRGGVATPATRGPSTVPARLGRPPKAAQPTPALHGSTGKHSDVPLSRAALAILKRMKPGRDYARADLADALGLSVAEWNSGINELKDARFAMQTGERRGARYRKTVEPGASP